MVKKNKKGFTLIEIIGTLVILTLIALLIVPNVIGLINSSRDEISKEQMRVIERSAQSWLTSNLSWIDDQRDICVSIEELINDGFIETAEVKDPSTKEPLNGFVVIKYDNNKYNYTYNETCSVEMARLRLEVPSNTFNSNGWAKANIEVRVIGDKNTAKYKYCTSTTAKCTPNMLVEGNTGKVIISTEGTTNYVCATAIHANNEESDSVCTAAYKLDKTAPTLNTPGTTTITNKVFNYNLMTGVTSSDNFSSGSNLKTEASGNISFGIAGDYVITYKATDQAGNTTTKTRIIKIIVADDGIPTLVMTLSGNPLNALGWAKTNVNINIAAQDPRVGIKNIKYCASSTGICDPNTVVNQATATATITTEGTTNYLCASTENNNGVVNDTVCVGPYKIDKTIPNVNQPADIIISHRETSFDLKSGTTYTDNLSPHDELTFQIIGGLSFGIFGEYPITYRVTDLAGNAATKIRNVIIGDDEKPEITLRVDQTAFNSNNWSNRNVTVAVSTDDADGIGVKNYTYCTSTSPTCTPNTTVNATEGSFAMSTESATNYACAVATDISNNVSDRVCIGPFKIDKTAPTLTVPGAILLSNRDTSVDLMAGVSTTDNLTASGSVSVTITGSVSLGIFGDYIITYHAKDLAGNVTSKTRTITVGDADAPTLTLNVTGEFNSNNYANRDITANITGDDGDGIGVKQVTYCTTTSTTCTPSTVIEGEQASINFGVDSNTNYICATATDHSNNVSNRICKGPYKVDKAPPTLTVPADLRISITATTFNINEGVSYSDNLTSNANLNYSTTGSVSLGIPADYPLTYTVTDQAGNITTKTRTVTVFNDIPPTVTLSVAGSPFNASGWARANFNINVATASQYGTVIYYDYCTSTSGVCTPNTTVEGNSGSITVSAESATNYVCVIARDENDNSSTRQCSGPHKLDKTNPSCNVTLAGTIGSNSWYTSDVTVSLDRSDSVSGISQFGLTTSTSATYNGTASTTHNANTANVTYYGYVIDAAGNTSSCSNTFKRDISTPTVALAVSGSPFNGNNWASANFTVNATSSSPGVSGIAKVTTCTTTSTSCTPTTVTNATSAAVTVSTESATNYVCAFSTDNAGRNSSTSCVGPYRLDKTAPTASHSGNVTFNTNTTSYDLWSGVTRSDALSGICSQTISGSVTLGTAGTYNITYNITDCAGHLRQLGRTFTITLAQSGGGNLNINPFRGYSSTSDSGRYDSYLYYDNVTRNGDTYSFINMRITMTRYSTSWTSNRLATNVGICGSENNVFANRTLNSSGTQSPATISVANSAFGTPSCSSSGCSRLWWALASTGSNSNWTNFQSGSPISTSRDFCL